METLPRWDLSELYRGPDDPRLWEDFRELETFLKREDSGGPETAGSADSEELKSLYRKADRIETFRYLTMSLGNPDPVPGDFSFGRLFSTRQVTPEAKPGDGLSTPGICGEADSLLSSPPVPPGWGKDLASDRPEIRLSAFRALENALDEKSGKAVLLYSRHLALLEARLPLPGFTDPLALSAADTGFSSGALKRLLENLKGSPGPSRWFRQKTACPPGQNPELWDLLAPPAGRRNRDNRSTLETPIPFSRAKALVCSAADSLSMEAGNACRTVFERSWVDAAPAEGKRGGAFTHPGDGAGHPFVFVNYTGTRRDVLNLGHEVFHAVHFLLAGEESGHPDTVLMEAVATMGEYLVLAGLDRDESGKQKSLMEKHEVLENSPAPPGQRRFSHDFLDLLFLKIYRQAALYGAERDFLFCFRQKGSLSREDMEKIWLEHHSYLLFRGQPVPSSYGPFWMTNRHYFHFPFYGLHYVLGGILALFLIAGLETPGGRAGAADLLKQGTALPAEVFARIFPDTKPEGILKKGFLELESCF